MAKETKKRVKLDTAQKRQIQDKKKNARNKSFKARLQTAKTQFLAKLDLDHLKTVHSLIDKCVKRGLFQRNKGDRLKSRLTKRVVKTAPAN